MRPIRVLVVDDVATVRRMLVDALSNDPMLQVVGTAPNGSAGLERVEEVHPDLVVLDVAMPVMDGLEMLKELRLRHPRLPVILFSSLTTRGAETTLNALWLGANDYVTKPTSRGDSSGMLRVRSELIPRIKALCAHVGAPERPAGDSGPTVATLASSSRRDGPPSRAEIVVIGASTGGPRVLAAIVSELPQGFPAPVLIVQHMPPLFTRHLASGLDATAAVDVSEAGEGDEVVPGRVLIAPGDSHLTVRREGAEVRVRLDQGPPENACRPSLNPLLRSVARAYGPSALAIVLTGMGQDGLEGCRWIHEAGGQVLVQDESTSVVWGMPGSVARAGLADAVLPPREIAQEIVRRAAMARRRVA